MPQVKNRILEMRQMTGLSQNNFAVALHIPVVNIQRWEQGRAAPPSYVEDLIEYKLIKEGLISKENADESQQK